MEFSYSETLAKTSIIAGRQKQLIQEDIFNNAPVRRIAIAMKTNSAFTGSDTENSFWDQQFDLRQIRIFRGGQPTVRFDAEDNCRLYIATMKAMNFQDDIPSIPIDNFVDHYELVFDFTSMREAAENSQYPELVGEPLRVEQNVCFSLEHVTQLIVLEKRTSSVALDMLVLLERKFKIDNVAIQQLLNRILLVKYRYLGSFLFNCVPTLPIETFATIKTQTTNMLGEYWEMIANPRLKCFLQTHSEVNFTIYSSSSTSSNASTTTVPFWRLWFQLDICSFQSLQVPARRSYRSSRC